MNDFLPDDYEPPKTGGKYMKFIKGDNKFRILSKAIVGYEAWTHDKKPVRKKMGSEFDLSQYVAEPKHFWAFPVWNYAAECVQVLQITQITIQKGIQSCVDDEDWGNPLEYDFKVVRSGDGMETEYTVTPTPHKPLDAKITKQHKDAGIDLEQLFEGLDPFGTEKLSGSKEEDQAGFKEEKKEEDLPF